MAVCWRLTVLLAIFLFFCVAFLTVCWKHCPAVFDGLTDPSTAATPGTEARLVGGGLLCKKVGAGPVSMDTAGWKYLRSSSSSLSRGTRATSPIERTSATRGSTVLIGLAGRDVKRYLQKVWGGGIILHSFEDEWHETSLMPSNRGRIEYGRMQKVKPSFVPWHCAKTKPSGPVCRKISGLLLCYSFWDWSKMLLGSLWDGHNFLGGTCGFSPREFKSEAINLSKLFHSQES